MGPQHIVNVSGGKDSTATYLLAVARGRPFRAVFADTGHEHPLTYEFIRSLARRAGGPEIEIARADFSAQIARKRAFIAEKWAAQGVPQDRVDRALAVLQPTGIPFLDLCLWKGRFPSTQARFCTEFLKSRPIEEQVVWPALGRGGVVRWQGERAEESRRRAALSRVQTVRVDGVPGDMRIFRPLLRWSAGDVFDLHRRHGVKWNPLYEQGMGRVGCMPCIMARKHELAQIAARFPEEVERVAAWERLVADASKRGLATFFAADKTPEGPDAAGLYPGIDSVAEWAATSRGGRQFALDFDAGAACSSEYGLCE